MAADMSTEDEGKLMQPFSLGQLIRPISPEPDQPHYQPVSHQPLNIPSNSHHMTSQNQKNRYDAMPSRMMSQGPRPEGNRVDSIPRDLTSYGARREGNQHGVMPPHMTSQGKGERGDALYSHPTSQSARDKENLRDVTPPHVTSKYLSREQSRPDVIPPHMASYGPKREDSYHDVMPLNLTSRGSKDKENQHGVMSPHLMHHDGREKQRHDIMPPNMTSQGPRQAHMHHGMTPTSGNESKHDGKPPFVTSQVPKGEENRHEATLRYPGQNLRRDVTPNRSPQSDGGVRRKSGGDGGEEEVGLPGQREPSLAGQLAGRTDGNGNGHYGDAASREAPTTTAAATATARGDEAKRTGSSEAGHSGVAQAAQPGLPSRFPPPNAPSYPNKETQAFLNGINRAQPTPVPVMPGSVSGAPPAKKPRRPRSDKGGTRTFFNKDQLEALEKKYAEDRYLAQPERNTFATSLDLTENQVLRLCKSLRPDQVARILRHLAMSRKVKVRVWFQNRRMKDKSKGIYIPPARPKPQVTVAAGRVGQGSDISPSGVSPQKYGSPPERRDSADSNLSTPEKYAMPPIGYRTDSNASLPPGAPRDMMSDSRHSDTVDSHRFDREQSNDSQMSSSLTGHHSQNSSQILEKDVRHFERIRDLANHRPFPANQEDSSDRASNQSPAPGHVRTGSPNQIAQRPLPPFQDGSPRHAGPPPQFGSPHHAGPPPQFGSPHHAGPPPPQFFSSQSAQGKDSQLMPPANPVTPSKSRRRKSDGESPGRRGSFTREQIMALEERYQKNHYMLAEERNEVAGYLLLTEAQIRVWFQNRRMKDKTNRGTRLPPPGTAPMNYPKLGMPLQERLVKQEHFVKPEPRFTAPIVTSRDTPPPRSDNYPDGGKIREIGLDRERLSPDENTYASGFLTSPILSQDDFFKDLFPLSRDGAHFVSGRVTPPSPLDAGGSTLYPVPGPVTSTGNFPNLTTLLPYHYPYPESTTSAYVMGVSAGISTNPNQVEITAAGL